MQLCLISPFVLWLVSNHNAVVGPEEECHSWNDDDVFKWRPGSDFHQTCDISPAMEYDLSTGWISRERRDQSNPWATRKYFSFIIDDLTRQFIAKVYGGHRRRWIMTKHSALASINTKIMKNRDNEMHVYSCFKIHRGERVLVLKEKVILQTQDCKLDWLKWKDVGLKLMVLIFLKTNSMIDRGLAY